MAYTCPTPCEPDCPASCHERHNVRDIRAHDPEECEQRQLGRDTTPLAPPPRLAQLPPGAPGLPGSGRRWLARLARRG